MQRIARDTATDAGGLNDYSVPIALIHRYFPPSVAALYATPRAGSDGVLQWWTSLPGQPLLFTELDAQQQQALLERYHERQARVGDLADELSRQGLAEDAAALRALIGSPELGRLYSVNGEPVVIQWVQPPPVPVVSALIPAAAPVVPQVALAPNASRWWRYWPAVLLLALLLLLLLWWLCPWTVAWRWWQADEPVRVPPDARIEAPSENITVPAQVAPETVVLPPPPEAEIPVPSAPKVEPAPKVQSAPKVASATAVGPPPGTRSAYACRAKLPHEQAPEFVTVFDTSGSMNLSIKATPEDEKWFFKNADNPFVEHIPGALDRLKRLTASPTRLDVAQKAFGGMVETLHPDIRAGLITYGGCRSPIRQGVFANSQRQQLIKHVNGLEADGGTPLAASLLEAAQMVNGKTRDAIIVAFVDGEDGCDQNQCLVAEHIAQEQPRLQINVVDITGRGLSNCVAEATGGRVFNPKDAEDVGRMLKAASADLASNADCP
jgi:hypothetical protein